MSYIPKTPPVRRPKSFEDVADALQYMERELESISRNFSETTELELRTVSVAPFRPRAGMIVDADGVNWNPGSGAGLYVFRGGVWVLINSGITSFTVGTAELNFGVFPGTSIATVDVASVGVLVTSKLQAWIRPTATADHTDIDHVAASMAVHAIYLSDGNFRIYGSNRNDVTAPDSKKNQPMFVGRYAVNWAWI